MKLLKLTAFLIFISTWTPSSAQFKYGDISIDNLKKDKHEKFPDAHSEIIYNSTSAEYEFFDYKVIKTTKIHVRIKIFKEDGLSRLNVREYLNTNSSPKDKFRAFKAVTYNLVDGEIEKTKLSKKEVFKKNIMKIMTLSPLL